MSNNQQEDVYADGADLRPPPNGPGLIPEVFNGATIFITGATGFLGQILVNKLLHSCPKINKLYLLIRPLRGKSPQERLKEMFSNSIFQTMKQKVRNYREKVIAVCGDCSLADLGLSKDDRNLIIRETNFIFHCASVKNVKEKLRVVTHVNVRALRDLITIAMKMRELKAFLYISTIYAIYNAREIDEKLYDPPLLPDKLLALVSSLDDDKLELITPSLLGKSPNIYFYTKAIAESLIRDCDDELPVAIVRPALSVATLIEPVAGWINNTDGPTGILCAVEMGMLHAFYSNNENYLEILPADYVANLILSAAWDVAQTRKTTENHEVLVKNQPISIYNFVSSTCNPLTPSQFIRRAQTASSEIPSLKQIWKRFCLLTSKKYVLLFYLFAFHYLPAFVTDTFMFITGSKPQLLSTYKQIHKTIKSMEYLNKNNFIIRDTNTQNLLKKMCDVDRVHFNFDLSEMRWDVYFYIYMRGIRVYLLNDPLETIPKAQRKNIFLNIAHYILCLTLLSSTYKLFLIIFNDTILK